MKKKKEPSKERMQPLSMYPLKPEEALTAFMEIDKKRLLRAEKKKKGQTRGLGQLGNSS